MLKKSFFLFTLVFLISCGPTIKTSSETKTALAQHKNVAIIPFEIFLGPKLHKTEKFTVEDKEELKRYMSIVLQQHLYELLKKKQKRFPLFVNIQSTELTNYLLSSKKISFAEVFSNDKKEICRVLGVDAIISVQTIFGKPENTSLNDMLNRGSMESNFIIYDSVLPGKIWSYSKTITDNILKDVAKTYQYEPPPETQYKAEDKYQKVLIPWIPSIDAMFQSFSADIPYKKR